MIMDYELKQIYNTLSQIALDEEDGTLSKNICGNLLNIIDLNALREYHVKQIKWIEKEIRKLAKDTHELNEVFSKGLT